MLKEQCEKIKSDFSLKQFMIAREKSWAALHKIASEIKVGMSEKEAQIVAEKILIEMGSTEKWHRTWIRFSEHTLLSYGVLTTGEKTLQKDDLFFIDMGPVWGGYEGDVGATFALGNNLEMNRCANDVKLIFDEVKQDWKTKHSTGPELYQLATQVAEKRGWCLQLKNASGHRLSDFPHTLYHKGSLLNFPHKPSENLWILEIQIRHPTLPIGAFYEDLLL